MQIELSQDELETVQQALECWEKESHTGALFASMLGAMLTRPEDKDKEKARTDEAMRKADEEGKKRKLKSLMLRAKLAQAVTTLLTVA